MAAAWKPRPLAPEVEARPSRKLAAAVEARQLAVAEEEARLRPEMGEVEAQ